MLKKDYFIECVQAKKYKELAWVINILSVTRRQNQENITPESEVPYELVNGEKGKLSFFDPVDKMYKVIEDSSSNEPLFYRKDLILMPGGTINIPVEVTELQTTIGNVLLNACTLFDPLGTKVPFMNGGPTINDIDKIDPGKMIKQVTSKVVSNDDWVDSRDAKTMISIAELIAWQNAVSWVSGFSAISNPTLTGKSTGTSDAVKIRRDELYEQYKDSLGNPAVQAKIEGELVKMDKEYLRDDPSYDFYYQDKHWANTRKKQYITTGIMSSIDGETKFIKDPLVAGIDASNTPAYADSIRHSSYSRGHLTALGGELVKYIYRITQNIKIIEKDCGTKLYLPDYVLPGHENLYLGRYFKDGEKLTEVTPENVSSIKGKILLLRSPAYCKTKDGNFCGVCMGKDLAATPNAIHTAAANPGSVMMNASMKAMHGKALKTIRFDYKTAIT